jgi:hypothetical protein
MGTSSLLSTAYDEREKLILNTHEPVKDIRDPETPPSIQPLRGLCFMTTKEEIDEECSHLKSLWHLYNQRKRVLERKEAKEGIDENPSTIMELNEVIQRMDEIEAKYFLLQEHWQLTSKEATQI